MDRGNMYPPEYTGDKSDAHLDAMLSGAEDQLLAAIQANLDLDAGLAEITGSLPPAVAAGPEEHWRPAFTLKEAARLGISEKEYESAALFARMAVGEHQRLGTARDRWEPTPIQNDHWTDPFITDGEQELARRLEKEADPALDEAQCLIENVRAHLDEIGKGTRPIAAPESGANYSVAAAVERAGQHDMKIERDEAVGEHHHHRTSVLLHKTFPDVRNTTERGSLAADPNAYRKAISDSRRDLADVAEIGDTLRNKTFPDICSTTQEAVNAVYGFYGIVRLLIGGLSADPPPQATKTIGKDTEGNIRGYIGTSIPGTRQLNLDPLFDRQHRLAEIENQRANLLDRINALPPHTAAAGTRAWDGTVTAGGAPNVADLIRDLNASNEAVEDQCLRACQAAEIATRSARAAELSAAAADRTMAAYRIVQAEYPYRRAPLPRQAILALTTVALDGVACYFAAQTLDVSQSATWVWTGLFLAVLASGQVALDFYRDRNLRVWKALVTLTAILVTLLGILRFWFLAAIGTEGLVPSISEAFLFTAVTAGFLYLGYRALRAAETPPTWRVRRAACKARRAARAARMTAERDARERDRRILAYLRYARRLVLKTYPVDVQVALESAVRSHLADRCH